MSNTISRRCCSMSGESIYNVIPEDAYVAPKGPLYKSKHNRQARKKKTGRQDWIMKPCGIEKPGFVRQPRVDGGGFAQKRAAGSFGEAKTTLRGPKNFLRKHEKEMKLPKKRDAEKKFQRELVKPRKPGLPSKKEKPIMGLTSDKDFVTENAVNAILMQAKKRKEDDNPLARKDFGKVPEYLQRVRDEVEEEYAFVADLQDAFEQREAEEEAKMRLLEEEERLELLAVVKERWEELNREYLKTPLEVNTAAQRNRKELKERELMQLERDIEHLSRKHVFVADD